MQRGTTAQVFACGSHPPCPSLAGWIQSNFIVTDPQQLLRADGDVLDCCFHCLRDGAVLAIQMNTTNPGEVRAATTLHGRKQ